MDSKYGEVYRELYEKHWWWRARSEFIVEKLRQLGLSGARSNILDIGCGDGLFFDRLAEFGEVEGVESCPELVSAGNPYRDRIFIGAFDEQFQPGKLYALILMLDVLEHLQDPTQALRRVTSLLEPGGKLVATVPSFKALWTNQDVISHHFTRYTKRSFREIARDAGLRILEERYFYYWTCPVKLGLGIVERFLKLPAKPPSVPPSWINESLYRISRFEQKTLRFLPVPFGSSLLTIAARET